MRFCWCFSVFSWLSSGQPTPEASTNLARSLTEANQFWLKGDATNGIPKYEGLLSQIQKEFGKDSSIEGFVLFRIGFLYARQGDFEKALPYLERSEKLTAPLPDDESNFVTKANLYWGLGMSYKSLLRQEQAIQAFDQSLKLKEKRLGADDPSLVEILIAVADLHSIQQRPLHGIPLLERALEISEKKFGMESAEAATVLASLGNTRDQAGQFEPALACLKRSLKIREKILPPTNPEVAIALHNLGSAYAGRGDYQQAMALLERGVELLEKSYMPDDAQSAFQFAGALNHLGIAQLESGDYDKAIATLQRSLAVTESAFGSASINLASALNSIALAYRRQGDFARAQRSYERGLRILEGAPAYKSRERVDTLNNLAQMLLDTGDEDAALRLFNQSLELGKKQFGGNDLSVAYGLNGLALIRQRRGDAPDALALFERSLAILENKLGTAHGDVAGALNNISALLFEIGETNQALDTLRRALVIQEQVLPKEHPAVATTLHNLGGILAVSGDLTNALVLFRRSVAITDALFGKDNPDSYARLENLAAFEIGAGEWEKGLDHFVEAARRRRRYIATQIIFGRLPPTLRTDTGDSMVDGFHSLFRLAQGWWLRPAAAACAEQLALGKAPLEEVETILARLASDSQSGVQELLGQSGNIRRQLDAIMRRAEETTWLKERTTWQSSKRDKLEQELAFIEKRMAAASLLVAQIVRERDLSLADLARNLPSQSALVDFIQYRRYETFAAKSNQWKELRYAAYLTFPLARDSTNIVVERLDLGEAAPINDAIELICRRMSAQQYLAKDLAPAIQLLSDFVYAPLAKHLTNVSHLIICPDGQLSRVPFELLRHEGKYLIEEKTISYVTSGREVVRLAGGQANEKLKRQNEKSLVMGNPDFDLDLGGSSRREEAHASGSQLSTLNSQPADQSLLTSAPTRSLSRSYRGIKFTRLPEAEAEARTVARLLGSDCVLRVGAQAREAELKSVVSPRVLHLATHGFFLSDQEFKRTNALPVVRSSAFTRFGPPEGGTPNGWAPRRLSVGADDDWENPMVRCGVALAGANRALQITNAVAEDGLLTGLEASLLNLQGTELVILSACDSGSGEVKIGEGVMSLRRAFRIAGAETVLASHWKVSDKATSQLMTEFMRRWRAGEPRAKAWREAQVSLLRSKDFSDPYFWAAFTLTGRWN